MHHALCIVDTTGTIISWNSKAQQCQDGHPAWQLGQHISCLYASGKAASSKPEAILSQALAEGSCQVQRLCSCQDGSQFWVQDQVTALFDAQDQHVGFAITTQELSNVFLERGPRGRYQGDSRAGEAKTHEPLTGLTAPAKAQLFVEALIESMPGILYFYDTKGQLLRWNQNLETVSGYSEAEITQMHPLDFVASREQEQVAHRMTEAFLQGEATGEATLVCKNGTQIPYLFTSRCVQFEEACCLLDIGINISERRQAEALLAVSEQKYRELIEHAKIIILRWTAAGYITFLNEFGQQFFGYAAEEIIGQHVMDTIVPDSDSRGNDLRLLMEKICQDPQSFEQNINENIRRDGQRVWIAWTNRVEWDAQGQVVEILSIGIDITARKQAEAEREKRFRAEAADRIKSAFLATMSHELRTPLNSIIGFTGIILQGLAGPLNSEQHKQLEMVRTSARHLLVLVNDVLDISKIEAGQLLIAREPFDLNQSITRVLASIQPQTQAKQLALQVQVPQNLGEALSDERRFEQVLLNLLSNAIKFTESGEVALKASILSDFQSPNTDTKQAAICLQVTDTGIGIQAEELPFLFQPFHQVNSGLARKHEGTGLGLAICHRLVTLMGGQINVHSEWGQGSTFTVTLPLHAPEPS